MSIEIIFGVVQAIVTAIAGIIFKKTDVPARYIPIQNIIIGIIAGLLAFYFGIYTDIPTALMLCLAISLGVGGAYDLATIPAKTKEHQVPEANDKAEDFEEDKEE